MDVTHSPIVRALAALTPLSEESLAQSITSYRHLVVQSWRVGFRLNDSEATTWHAFNASEECSACVVVENENAITVPDGCDVVTSEDGFLGIVGACRSCGGCGRTADVSYAWESLATAGLIAESWLSDDSRSFVCDACDGLGGALAPEGKALIMRACRACNGIGEARRPTTMHAMLSLLARGMPSLMRAEELIRVAAMASGSPVERFEWTSMSPAALDKHHQGAARGTASIAGVFSSECTRGDGNSWPVDCDWPEETTRAAWRPLRAFAVGAVAKPSPTGFHLLHCSHGTARIAVESIAP